MKKIFLSFFVFMLHLTLNAEECSCGSFEQGIYTYDVIADSGGCCAGINDTNYGVWFTTYRSGPGNTWIATSSDRISFSDAVRACCPTA